MLLAGETASLAGAVGVAGAGGVGRVGPLALDLPLGAVRESDQRCAKRPRALVAVLRALRIVPGAGVGGVAASFRQLMAADIGQRGQTLGVKAGGVARVAPGVPVKLEEVGELDADAVAGANAVVCAVAGVAARGVGVDGIVAVAGGVGLLPGVAVGVLQRVLRAREGLAGSGREIHRAAA